MSDQGNAVNAKWVGPSGTMQLWDGHILNTGDIVLSIGADEAAASPYWQVLKTLPKNAEPVSDVGSNRIDAAQDVAEAAPAEPEVTEPAPDPAPTPDDSSKGAGS